MKSLLANQLKKEIRHYAGLLAIWWGIVLLFFLKSIGHADNIFFEGHYVISRDGSPVITLMGIGFLLPLLMGIGDSPSCSRGFILTRPVAARTIWLAKGLVVGLLLALPLSLVSFGVAAMHGTGLADAVLLSLDRLVIVLPLVLFFLFWGGLMGSLREVGVMAVAGSAIMWAMGLLALGVLRIFDSRALDRIFREPGSLSVGLLVVFWVGAVLSALALWRQIQGPRKRFRSLFVFGGIGLALMLVLTLPGLNVLRPDTRLPEELVSVMEDIEVQPDRYFLSARRQMEVRSGVREEVLRVQTPLDVAGLPPDVFVHGSVTRALLADGQGFTASYEAPSTLRKWTGALQMTRDAMLAMVRLTGRDLTVYHPERSFQINRQISVAVPFENSDALEDRLGRPLRFECAVDLDCFAVRQVARMAFQNGATSAPLEGGNISVMCPPHDSSFHGSYFALRTRDLNRWVTRDEGRRMRADWSARQRYLCLITHPSRPEALFPELESVGTNRGALTGLPERVRLFNCQLSKFGDVFDAAYFAEAEIRVLRLDWLGRQSVETSMADVHLQQRLEAAEDSFRSLLSGAACHAAIEEMGALPQVPTEDDLAELLDLFHHAERWDESPGDVLYGRLLELGRRNFGLLMTGLDWSESRPRRAVYHAVGDLAGEAQRERVIAALGDHPDLSTIVVEHGWEGEAREVLLGLMRDRRPLPHAALSALVSYRDEESYPFLLEQFAHRPQETTYDLLWEIDELREPLDGMVAKEWRTYRRFLPPYDQIAGRPQWNLALRTGDREALDLAFEMLKDRDRDLVVHGLRPVMLLPRDRNRAMETLRALSSEALEFDPERRIYRLDPDTIERPEENAS